MTECTPGEPATWTWPDAYDTEGPMDDVDRLLDAIASHLDALRARADRLDRIGAESSARWLRAAADALEDAAVGADAPVAS